MIYLNYYSYDIRWKQRFQNYTRAFNLLNSALENKEISEFSELEQSGIIQWFEMSFELAWQTLKDYLEYDGVKLKTASPKSVIKECASLNIFENAGIDGQVYIDMLDSRNSMAHIYDSEKAKEIINQIKENYLPELRKQYLYLLKESVSEE